MRISHKLGKLISGGAYTSTRRRVRQIVLRRETLDVAAARLTRTVDHEKFAEIYRRHAVENPGGAWPKYLDLQRWIEINLRRVRDLDLDLGGRKRVLDIGCGTGYFLYICEWLGHDTLGIDLDAEPGFTDMVNLLALKRVIWRVEAFVPLPSLGDRFDVIAAHMICFNGHKSKSLWKITEWEFFLNDIAQNQLRPGGQLCLDFNREYDGTHYTPELKAYFLRRGAELHTRGVLFKATLRRL